MKFIARKPRDGWISPYTIVEKCWPWHNWDDIELEDYPEVPVKLATIISRTISWITNKCKPQQFVVKLDPWDTWSMEYTLAQIIHPMLVQLHKTNHGSPFVDDGDVPEHLRSTSAPPKEHEWDIDALHHDRWEYVMQELIWTFAQLKNSDHDKQFYTFNHEPNQTFEQPIQNTKVDKTGLEQHQQRIDNGLRLFGRYYQALWD